MEISVGFFSGLSIGTLMGLLIGAISAALFYLRINIQLKAQLMTKDADLQILTAKAENSALTAQHMSDRFELLAAKIFEEKSAKFQDQNLKNLSIILEPFKERLKDFEKKVEDSYSQERSERGSLRGELSKLMELNIKMTSETESLTKALKGDTRTQGAWGEMVLENILESSGLRKNEEYIVQASELSLRNEDGNSIRPDVIINLPEGKHIIIDSKVSLTAYDLYINSDNSQEQERQAKIHTDSLRRHIDNLSAKKYHTADKLLSPDFVILFMPMEPAFALAMKMRPELQQEAWDKRVAIVSPTTLLVTLKMVAAIWKTERQERNALEIAERGGQLYDKFVGLVNDLENVGKKIDEAQKAHTTVMGKMKDGSGNLLRQVDILRELGVKTTKRLLISERTDQ